MRLFDTHAHLHFPDFADDLDAVIERARGAGVRGMVTIGTDRETNGAVVKLAQRVPEVWATVGIHPHDAAEAVEGDFESMERVAREEPKVVGFGEMGLDFFRNLSPPDAQRQVFRRQIDIARRVPAPVDRCDAVDWLRIHLADPRPSVATIVYHSVVMPYLTEENRENVRRVIEDAGSRATADAPLAWLSMEPGADQADVHLTMWPGGERRLIAQAGFHGRDVKVL